MSKGKVWLVGAGPGDAGLLTQKGAKLLKMADVIVYDALISLEILCQIPVATPKIYAGKRAGQHSMPQNEINQ
ncbi:MAG: uroporphyrinogen-III C-methyltransferase, partial [Firmicutes bacterium]|nr:uroporphyrinogen-III C-methyltransferase [Bacillota bacterium]